MATIIQPTSDQLNKEVDRYLKKQPQGLGFVIGYASPQFQNNASNVYTFGNVTTQGRQPMAFGSGTLFEIASVSKTVTATLYAYLLSKQKNKNLTLGDIPLDIGTQFAQIPLLTLANYTSGFPFDNSQWAFIPTYMPQPYTMPGMLGFLNFTDLSPQPPGQQYTYSNLAFSILAATLPYLAASAAGESRADATPVSFESLVQELIFDPLNMSSAQYFDDVRLDALPLGYDYSSSTTYAPIASGSLATPAYNGGGGIVASGNDMMQWLLFNMQLVKNSNLTPLLPQLQSPSTTVTTPEPDSQQLGLGWFIAPAGGNLPAFIWKDGGLDGAESFMTFLSPQSGQPPQAGVFVLCNAWGIVDESGTAICDAIALNILNIMLGHPPPADTSVYPRRFGTFPARR